MDEYDKKLHLINTKELLEHNLGRAALIMEKSKNTYSKAYDLLNRLNLIEPPISNEEVTEELKNIVRSLYDINAYAGNIYYGIKGSKNKD